MNLSLMFAQTGNNEKCGSETVHRMRLLNEPGYADAYEKLQKYVKDFIADNPDGYSPKTVITIPVVFHIVLSPAENASFPDTRCVENINSLNTDFAGLNTHSMGAFALSLKTDCEIRFCLASVSPTGVPTTGIERVNYTGPTWAAGDNGVKQSVSGGLDAWDPTQYFNIWVCNLEDGLCGYGTLPTSLNNFYGLVNDYEYTGMTGASPPFNLGGTVTHGIGHCFNLPHIWGDSPGCVTDDGFGDTPTQDMETYGAPVGVLLDACQPSSPGIMYMNFMDYTDDISMANYTPGQKTAMLALFAPGGVLEPLTSSDKCGDPLVADFVGNPLTVNVGGTVNFTDLTTGSPAAWQWTFTGAVTTSSAVQNPQNIQYNVIGLYPVKLKVTKPNFADSITKIQYIEVIDPLAVNADFIGTPTVVAAGNTVNFTDLSTNTPTSWQWNFYGGTPSASTAQNPQNILYNTPGVYDVRLRAANVSTNDTVRKIGYIVVANPSDIPQAEFVANPNSLLTGSTSWFTDLSSGIYDSVHWYFSGGVPSESTLANPPGIFYSSTGDYDVTLIIMGPFGNDTLIKAGYMHVFDTSYLDSVFADFHATTSRLIVQGSAVNFEDLSGGNTTNWTWQFQGGTPSSSSNQNPLNVLYYTPGIYDVCLIVSNGMYSDTLCKQDYIIVTTEPWPDPNGFCDTISNRAPNELPLWFLNLATSTWGYVPGHNGLHKKAYADKFVNYTYSEISRVLVQVAKASAGTGSSYVRFKIWSGTYTPQVELGYKDILISDMIPFMYYSVSFNPPIPVNGTFFIGYELNYTAPQDTFVTYLAPDRGPNGLNTLYVKNANNSWQTMIDVFGFHTSLAIQVIGCLTNDLVDIEPGIAEDKMVIYPIPSSGIINIGFSEKPMDNDYEISIFDMFGKQLPIPAIQTSENQFQIDCSDQPAGLYLVFLRNGTWFYKTKLSVVH